MSRAGRNFVLIRFLNQSGAAQAKRLKDLEEKTAKLKPLLAAYFFDPSTSDGWRINFCTRQLITSATYSSFSDGHAIP